MSRKAKSGWLRPLTIFPLKSNAEKDVPRGAFFLLNSMRIKLYNICIFIESEEAYMGNTGKVVCDNCGKEIEYVQGKRWKISDGGIPEAVSVPEGKKLIWDNESFITCPECGNRIKI